MEKTYKELKKFRVGASAIMLLIGLGMLGLGIFIMFTKWPMWQLTFTLSLLAFVLCSAAGLEIRIKCYKIGTHEVVCYSGLYHRYLIVDNKIIDKADDAWGFAQITLKAKVEQDNLEMRAAAFSVNLKVNDQLVMPVK